MTTAERRLQDLPEMIVRDVAELPDRSSPEGQPEIMLVTAAELDRIVTDRVAEVAQAGGVTEEMIDRAARAWCCPDTECIPETTYCARRYTARIRRMLEAALIRGEENG